MADELTSFLTGKGVKEFRPHPYYSPDGDFLTFFLSDGDSIAKRVDELLTVYLSPQTNDLVGAKIKGVTHILRPWGASE